MINWKDMKKKGENGIVTRLALLQYNIILIYKLDLIVEIQPHFESSTFYEHSCLSVGW